MSYHSEQVQPDRFVRFVHRLASMYVAYPQELTVNAHRTKTGAYVVTILGNHRKEDFGKLLGGQRKNLMALVHLVQKFGQRFGVKAMVNLLEPPGARVQSAPVQDDPHWGTRDDADMAELLQETCDDLFLFHSVVTPRSENGRTYLTILTDANITPETLNALSVLFKAIGRNHGRRIEINAEAPPTGDTAV